MTLFIREENQTILWDLINKDSSFQTYFASSSQNVRQEWFRANIKQVYDSISEIITKEELLQINRKTLLLMKQNLSQIVPQNLDIPQNLNREGPVEEYKPFEVKKPEEIDFSEKIEDEKITNMSELIEKQRRMRELDYETNKVNILQDISMNDIEQIKISKNVSFDIEPKIELSDIIDKLNSLDDKLNSLDDKLSLIFENQKQNKIDINKDE
jgi:hypothetical protein